MLSETEGDADYEPDEKSESDDDLDRLMALIYLEREMQVEMRMSDPNFDGDLEADEGGDASRDAVTVEDLETVGDAN